MSEAGWARHRDQGLTVLVVVEAILLFGVVPLASQPVTVPLELALSVAIVAAALVILSNRPRVAAVIGFMAIGSLVVRLVAPSPQSREVVCLVAGGDAAFLALLSGVLGGAVFAPGRVTTHRIRGAVAIYLQTGLFFAQCYSIILALVPRAFTVSAQAHPASNLAQMLYFSFVTLTSTGYGDIAPVHPIARAVANFEALVGQLFPATLLARLVTLELQSRDEQRKR